MKSSLEIYRSEGETQIDVRFENETVWLNRSQIAILFGRDIKTIGKHLTTIFSEGELVRLGTVANFATVQNEGLREVERQIEFYNLDVIISLGYRVKSKEGTHFRQWATQRLKDYLIKGYAVNQERLSQLQQSFQLIREAALSDDFSKAQVKEIIDVLADYALGLDILDGYDKQNLERGMVQPNSIFQISYQEAKVAIEELRIKFGGSLLFGNEKDDSFKSSISTINQTFDSKELYPSIEEKAAHLLYFVVKNHSFTDGNKRIAAWLFVWYLAKNNYLLNSKGIPKMANNALAAITLMVALSKPEEKDLMILVIVNSINKAN
ncbi:MAG: virulence protein RhuM/Fic/DOC family protein [Algoriphagus sp.]|jgi:prophage maintenance system killer protein|uniref:RhuM family protein n=1 Tax=Algoriphagus sp. TaxID=1872435 RepID=UPI002743A71F|nr:virulence protein RhuM/Fic/DOC family protein [Algoriphagus sp.]MDP4748798.1 virulence protein RhuM/Fic/DOC family protein [Algoriphagus sp.]MDP4905237.1 virulence protein RhuM/Fic/DOC family protein [Algoriphagus sp.]